ncbi:T9SS type A sorting domain-containing protein [bacterium]|nr:T9SS type A sorting domain-containing protein [bacterium]
MKKLKMLKLISFIIIFLYATSGMAEILNVPDTYSTIQEAINNTIAGDTINVAPGVYREQLSIINKNITLVGSGVGLSLIEAPNPENRSTYQITQWNGSTSTVDAILGIQESENVTVSGFSIDGRQTGPANYYGIHIFNSSVEIHHCKIENILYPASPRTRSVLSLISTHGIDVSYDVNIHHCEIPNFQKGGIAILGPGASFDVSYNTIVNALTTDNLGNGIQLSYGASGSTMCNNIQGAGDISQASNATGILLFESGDLSMTNDVVNYCQVGINFCSWNWMFLESTETNILIDGLEIHSNEFAFVGHLAGNNSDVNIDISNLNCYDNTDDGIEIYGTGVDPWGGTFYTGWLNGDLSVSIINSTIADNGVNGIWTADYSGNSNIVIFDVHESSFLNCSEQAISNGFSQTIDATYCYWNDSDGPVVEATRNGQHRVAPLSEPFGMILPQSRGSAISNNRIGESVSGPIYYEPWYRNAEMTILGGDYATMFVVPDSSGPIICDQIQPLHFLYMPESTTPPARGYEVTFHGTEELSFSSTDVIDSGALSGIGEQSFHCYDNDDGSVTIAATLLGVTDGLANSDSLFCLNVTGQQSGVGQIVIDEIVFRDLANGEVAIYGQGLAVEVLCLPTSLTILPETSDPIICDQVLQLDFIYAPQSALLKVRGYEVSISGTEELSFSAADVIDSGALSDIGGQAFYCYDNDDGSVTVAAALLGLANGLASSDTLFAINITGQQTGTGQLIIDELILRDLNNGEIVIEGFDLEVEVECAPVLVENLPQKLILFQNYPNPFNPQTTISFVLPEGDSIILNIYDLSGRLVHTVIDDYVHAGTHNLIWKSKGVASGIYYYRLSTTGFSKTKKMVLIK